MPDPAKLSTASRSILQKGGVFVPSPLALNEKKTPDEKYQRLLTLYYITSGAQAVIPGAHTGEFALNDLDIFINWLDIVKEMTAAYGSDMILMAAIGGKEVLKQAEISARKNYDIVMVAPTAFQGRNEHGIIGLLKEIASIIPTFGFELQRAIPGSYAISKSLWSEIFEITYGAKGASFDTYRSITMLEAAANSSRKNELAMLTGNDDRIVSDLFANFSFPSGNNIQYCGGLLGHFATDTQAAVNWVNEILVNRNSGIWQSAMDKETLTHAVNYCNMVLFDALGNFENSVWGVKYRLSSLGLLPGPYCAHENGRPGQGDDIDQIYGNYPMLTDDIFLKENLDWMKGEVGIK